MKLTPPVGWFEQSLVDRVSGLVDRPARLRKLWVPAKIVPDYKKNGFWYGSADEERPIRPGILHQFLTLGSAKSSEIVKFVERWGPLYACSCHNRLPPLSESCKVKSKRADGETFSFESFDAWRDYAKEFRGILNIAATLKSNKPGNPFDWIPWKWASEFGSIEDEAWGLARRMHYLIIGAGVTPYLTWTGKQFVLEFGGWEREGFRNTKTQSLYAVLVFQLMLAVTATESMLTCSNCGRTFVPLTRDGTRLRRRDPSRRVYCTECGKQASDRAAKRDSRRRIRESKRLYGEGKRIAEIAAIVGRPQKQIRKWVKGVPRHAKKATRKKTQQRKAPARSERR